MKSRLLKLLDCCVPVPLHQLFLLILFIMLPFRFVLLSVSLCVGCCVAFRSSTPPPRKPSIMYMPSQRSSCSTTRSSRPRSSSVTHCDSLLAVVWWLRQVLTGSLTRVSKQHLQMHQFRGQAHSVHAHPKHGASFCETAASRKCSTTNPEHKS